MCESAADSGLAKPPGFAALVEMVKAIRENRVVLSRYSRAYPD